MTAFDPTPDGPTRGAEYPLKTDSRHRGIRNARSIPDIDFDTLTVSNMAMNSRSPRPAPGHKRVLTAGRYGRPVEAVVAACSQLLQAQRVDQAVNSTATQLDHMRV